MKEYLLQNKKTGNLGVGIKMSFFDQPMLDEPLANVQGYSVKLVNQNEFDAWAITSSDKDPWIMINKKVADSLIECLGEL